MDSSNADRELQKALFNRHDVLAVLAEQPRTKPELVSAVDSSRSTIDRAVAELEGVDCIERVDGAYRPTLLGRISLSEYRDYAATMDDAYDARSLLGSLPSDASLSADFLRDATVRTANPSAPESALEPAIERLDGANRLSALAPVTLSLYVNLIEAYAGPRGLDVELVVPQETLDSLLGFSRDRFEELRSTTEFSLHVTDESLPYALWVVEDDDGDVAGLTVYENGGVRGLVMNDSPEAVAWARDEYESYRATATERRLAAIDSERAD